MGKILLDTNLIVGAFDDESNMDPAMKEAAKNLLAELLDDGSNLYVSPLIRYEVLRGVNFGSEERYRKLKEVLDDFPQLEITTDVSELAANLFRFDTRSDEKVLRKNPDKYRFDVFHFSCAEINSMEVKTHDGEDFKRISDLYERYQKNGA